MKNLFVLLLLSFYVSVSGQISLQYTHYTIPNNVMVDRVATGDFSGDGLKDVITMGDYPPDTSSAYFYIFQQNNTGRLDSLPLMIPYSHPNVYFNSGLATADIDRDGLIDVVIGAKDSFYIYYQTAAHTLTARPKGHYAGQDVGRVRTADIDGDGHEDIAVSITFESYISVYYGTAIRDSFIRVDYPSIFASLDDLRIGYVGIDSELSILRTSGTISPGYILQTKISAGRQADTTRHFFCYASSNMISLSGVASGDRFGTGVRDLVAVSNTFSPAFFWDQPNTDTLYNDTAPAGIYPTVVVMADLNCDGKMETITANSDNQISVISQTDTSQIFYANIPNSMSLDGLAAADVSGDGRQDIIIANTYGGLSVFINTTPESLDSFSLHTDTLILDTSFINQPNTTIVSSHRIATYGDTAVVLDTTFLLTHYQAYSLYTTTTTGLALRLCHGDTVVIADTVYSVVGQRFYADSTVVSISIDTVLTTGVEDITLEEQLHIYPNPFSIAIRIDGIAGVAQIELYNTSGSLILSQVCSDHCIIDRQSMAQGIYVMKVTSQAGVSWHKVVAF